jgi:hypothetical protein
MTKPRSGRSESARAKPALTGDGSPADCSSPAVTAVLEYCGYTTLRTRNRQIWKCVWPKIVMSYKNVLYDLNTKFSTKFSTSVHNQCVHTAVEQPVGLLNLVLPSTN